MGIGGIKILSEYNKVRIIVAFGDISGFSHFCDSVTNDEVEYDPLMHAFDELIEKTERETGYSFTDTGDGFMCTVDIEATYISRKAIKIVLDLYRLFKRIEALFNDHRKSSVCPEGFRIALTAGYVKRKVKNDGRILLRGKSINQAHNFLDIARDYGLVAHESFKILVNEEEAKKAGIEFMRIRNSKTVWGLKIQDERKR